MTDISKHFLVLGLDTTATPAQVKEARHWYTKAFHPDRFPKDSPDQKKAEEKQKEINLAFEHITAWFKAGGSVAGKKQRSPGRAEEPRTYYNQLEEYMDYLSRSDRRLRTLENVFCDLKGFVDWLESHRVHKCLDNTARSLVLKYANAMTERGYKPLTIARHLHSIRGWFIFCKLDASFILELAAQYKSTTKIRPKSLPDSQVAKLLASVKRHARKEDRLLVELLLHTGLTAGEVCGLTWRDISINNTPGTRQRCVMLEIGGRSGFRDIPASEKAVSTLVELGMNEFLSKGGKGLDSPIFQSGGYALTPKMVHYAVSQCGSNASVDVTPSSLRNTFAFRLALSNVSRLHLAEYMGISEQSASVYYPTKNVSLKDLVNVSRKA